MTEKQLERQLKKIIKDNVNILEECKKIILSGAIDFSNEKLEGYTKANVILKAALENAADKIRLFGSEAQSDYKNLKKI